jgi:pyruvate dehydrogenase E1 component beta subunit
MSRTLTYREAVREAMSEEIERDESVFLIGEEVAQYNGAYKVSEGMLDKYGPRRIVDAPITETGFAGLGIGAAMVGLRPIVEFMTWNFSFVAFDQLVSSAAKMRYMSGGQFRLPITFRGPAGAAHMLGAQHSHAPESVYGHFPGLKVAVPATPADAKGLLKTAIRDDDPVLVMESEVMYSAIKGEVPDGDHLVPLGKADIKLPGKDVTIVTYGKAVHTCLAAAKKLAEEGIEAEIVDLRSIRPLDMETVLASVAKTNRAVVVHEAWGTYGVGAEVSDRIQREAFDDLDAPIERVSGLEVPMPYAHNLEKLCIPDAERVIEAARRVLYL